MAGGSGSLAGVDIHLADEQDVPLSIGPLRRLARLVLEAEGLPAETEVGVMFVSDEVMAEYNRRFLGREGPTDVLALPLNPPGAHRRAPSAGAGAPYGLGDVFVAPGYVRRRAGELGVRPEDEMFLMVAHGLLHLIGYDHGTEAEAESMEARERELLARAGAARR